MNVKRLVVLVGLGVGLAGSRASAQNLLINPGFETGDMTGWTVAHLGSFSGVNNGGGTPHSGVDYFGMGAISLADQTDFYQDVATTVGQTYIASFWAYDRDTPPSGQIHVTFGGVDIGPASGTVTSGPPYVQYSLTFTATAASTRLESKGWEANLWVISYDYSVSAVPEPATLSLLALGFGIRALRRRS